MRHKFGLIATILLVTGTASGQCPLTFDGSEQALIGAYIAPVNGGLPLVDYNSSKLMTPASVMKSVTTASVLSKYPGDFQWCTTVMAVGDISNGVLDGNLVIRGSGDPTIESRHFKSTHEAFLSVLMSGIESADIDSITGQVILESHWPDEGAVQSWELEDIPGIDGAGFYTLNYMDNIFQLEYPSLQVKPFIPGLEILDKGGTGRLKTDRNFGSNVLNVHGKLGRKERKAVLICSMPNPTEVALHHISDTLHVQGANINAVNDTVVVATYKSPFLRDVVRSYMVRSDNMMAEATLRLMTPQRPRSDALKAQWNLLTASGASLENANICDGSGLSRHNTISPAQLCSVLRLMASNPDYVNSFARVGKDGTVKNFMKDMPGREHFALKSGSMTGVVAYAGYRLDPSTQEPTHVIAVIVNNAPFSSKVRKAIAELLSSLEYQ